MIRLAYEYELILPYIWMRISLENYDQVFSLQKSLMKVNWEQLFELTEEIPLLDLVEKFKYEEKRMGSNFI